MVYGRFSVFYVEGCCLDVGIMNKMYKITVGMRGATGGDMDIGKRLYVGMTEVATGGKIENKSGGGVMGLEV